MHSRNTEHTRVLIILYYYYPYVSGLSVYAKRIAEGLVQKGYQVTVLTSRFDEGLVPDETINGVHVIRRPVLFRLGKGVIMPTFWLDIIRYSGQHDYVNFHLPMADSGLSALFIPKSKMITTYHCDLNLGNGLLSRLITNISSALMQVQLARSRLVVANSRDYFAHSRMRRYMGKLHPVYPPVTASDFTPLAPEPLFSHLGIPADATKIGFVGRIVYEKGIPYLLAAIPRLKMALPKLRIILAGDYESVAGGSVKDQLDQWSTQYPGTILFTGFLSDVDRNRFYSGLDVFALPSIDALESFGMVQVEALLCGAPLVASDLPGVREVVNVSHYGRTAKPRDPDDLAEQIIEVVRNRKRYQPKRQQVIDHLCMPNAIDTYSSLMPKNFIKPHI